MKSDAFRNQGIPFFEYNAQFWFIISIARIAIDYPQKIQKFKDNLLLILEDTSNPHVGIQMAVCEALQNCVSVFESTDSREILEIISSYESNLYERESDELYDDIDTDLTEVIDNDVELNHTGIDSNPIGGRSIKKSKNNEPDVNQQLWNQIYGSTDEKSSDCENEESENIDNKSIDKLIFHLEMDFSDYKYSIRRLAEVFDLQEDEIMQMCIDCMTKWVPNIHENYKLSSRNLFTENSNSVEDHQSYGIFVGWHALAVVAGKLCLNNPINKYRTEEWNEWLSDFRITNPREFWIADGTLPYPVRALNYLLNKPSDSSELSSVTTDEDQLLSLIGIEKPNFKDIIAHGNWRSPDNVACEINSALVKPKIVDLFAQSVTTSPPFFKKLPHFSNDSELRTYSEDFEEKNCIPWITLMLNSPYLDEYDPLGSRSAINYISPSSYIR